MTDVAGVKASVSLAAVIGETLQLGRQGRFLVGLCPFHGERTPSFYVYPDHFHCFGCGAHGDILDWLSLARRMSFAEAIRYIAGERLFVSTPIAAPPPPLQDQARNLELARRLWAEAVEPAGTPVATYLGSRGVQLPQARAIRFHPECRRGEERLPAMVALMTDPTSGEPRGVHRTFLRPDGGGKADGSTKMMLGGAGVVRLVPDAHVTLGLGIAEGIETGLAVMQHFGWRPVWAAGTAVGIATFPVLPGIECLSIFADADDKGAGVAAANRCADVWREAGREALVQLPPGGMDWLDAVTRLAA